MKTTAIRTFALIGLIGMVAPLLFAQQPKAIKKKSLALYEQMYSQDSPASQKLQQVIELNLHEANVEQALNIIAKEAGLKLMYTKTLLPKEKKITLQKSITLYDALWKVLDGTGLRFALSQNRQLVLLKSQKIENQVIMETVAGQVTDASTEESLPGVNVLVKGTTTGASTDSEGNYELNVPLLQDTLVFSFIGYQTQEVPINGRTELDVALQPQAISGEELVVVGYGTQQRQDVTGSVKQISGADFAEQPSVQTSSALMGKVAGVQVTQNSGQPGNNQGTIRIRGTGTLGNSNPLVLIDGVEGNLDNVPSSDIESISVLKDAAGAAVYGSRAANGVILVTTKRGQQGEIQVNYRGFFGWQQATDHPEYVDGGTFMRLENEGATNLGMAPIWSEDYIQEWEDNHVTDPSNYPSTDWVGATFSEPGIQQRHNLGISGGTELIQYMGSLSYDEENSNVPNYGFERYSIRLNTDVFASDELNFNLDLNLKRSDQVSPPQSIGRIITDVYRIPSVYVAQYSHGGWGPALNLNNPVAYVNDGGTNTIENSSVRARLYANYQPIEGLEIDVMYSPDYQAIHDKSMVKQYEVTDPSGNIVTRMPENNSLSQSYSRDFTHNFNTTVQYENIFAKRHTVNVLGGYEFINFRNTYFNAFRDQFQLQDFEQLNAGSAANQQNAGSASSWALQSFFGRITYDYDSKYLFEANLRYDGSSRFSEGNRWGIFPSFSTGWIISKEKFMESINFISSLKLRGSWGKLGNQQIGTYPFASTIDLSQSYIFGGSTVGGAAQLELANPDISWEKTTTTNVGMDVALLEDRLNFTFDYFERKTTDILLQLPIPQIVGLVAPFQNAGEVENTGWEVEAGYQNMIGDDFFYSVSFNLSNVKNVVTNLRGAGPFISEDNITMEGHPIDAIYGYESDGLFDTQEEIDNHAEQTGQIAPGDIRYVDQNGDDIINSDDRVIIGDPFPSLNYGINLSANFKGFDISVFFQGVGRRDVYLSSYAAWPLYNGSNVRKWQANDYWTPDNMDASMPRFTQGSTHSNFTASDYWVYDASYLRLRNLQIGYNLPSNFTDKLFFRDIRVYFLGQNLITLFDEMPPGVDPNVPGGSAYFPISRLLSFGIDINF